MASGSTEGRDARVCERTAISLHHTFAAVHIAGGAQMRAGYQRGGRLLMQYRHSVTHLEERTVTVSLALCIQSLVTSQSELPFLGVVVVVG